MTSLRTDIRFDEPGRPVTQSEIDEAKVALGIDALPLDYERYLLRFNGARPSILGCDGNPVPQLIRIWRPADGDRNTDHAALFEEMYALAAPGYRNLVEVNQVVGHLFPPFCVAFGCGAGGSRFLFDLRPERFGQVLYWDYLAIGNEDDFARDPYHNVGWLASDFVDFINRIEVEPFDFAAWEAALAPDSDLDWQSR